MLSQHKCYEIAIWVSVTSINHKNEESIIIHNKLYLIKN